jgi:hypothetical protein
MMKFRPIPWLVAAALAATAGVAVGADAAATTTARPAGRSDLQSALDELVSAGAAGALATADHPAAQPA